MVAKATPALVPTPGVHMGEFRIERFEISNAKERKEYESIRTRGNKSNSGITIENIRDQSEVTEHSDGDAVVKVERWFVVVSWWEKGIDKNEAPDLDQGFYAERKSQ